MVMVETNTTANIWRGKQSLASH